MMTSNNQLKKTVLVTGAGGFFGTELIKQLLNRSCFRILSLVRDKTKHKSIFNSSSVVHYDNEDLTNGIIPFETVDILIHSAFSRQSNGILLAESLLYTTTLFSLARNNGVKSIINISSQGVYGQANKPPWREDMHVAPDSLYAIAKYSSELIAMASFLSPFHNINFTNIRLPGLTGGQEGLKKEVVSRFVSNAIEGLPIKIIGGTQVFSNMDVRDAVEGVIKLLYVSPVIWKRTYNLGNIWRHSIIEIAEMVKEIAPNYTSKPVVIEVEEKDVTLESGMDSSLFYKDTGWSPKYTMKDIIVSLFEYLVKHDNKKL
jgi:nucleoside-diphosphate-sugar epimerase